MFCTSCGKEIYEGSKFCEFCGANVEGAVKVADAPYEETLLVSDNTEDSTMLYSSQGYEETVLVGAEKSIDATDSVVLDKKKKNKNKIIIAIIAVLLALSVGIGSFFALSGGGKGGKLLDLGEKYLEEQDYDSAIATFNKILATDPKNVDAYLGIVEVYIRQGDYDKALEIAEEGYEKTHDERLQEKIDMIESGNIYDSRGRSLKVSFYDGDGTYVAYHTYTYDAEGRTDVVSHYNADGTFVSSIQCKYDADGNQLVSYGGYADTGELIKHEYTYKKGKTMTDTEILKDGSKSVTTYEYDGDKVILESIERTSSDGSIYHSYYEFEYDKMGRQSKRIELNDKKELRGYSTFKYDKRGYLIEQCSYDEDGKLTSKYVSTYDKNGNQISSEGYDGDGNLSYSHKYE